MQYAIGFIALQVKFAQKIAEVSNQALTDVLIDYTMLRNLFNLRVSHDLVNPLWEEFLQGLREHQNPENWAYEFYLRRANAESHASDERNFYGCFSYVYPWRGGRTLRLHFENRDTSGGGTLSPARMEGRKAELKAMFRHIRDAHPDVATVRGGSWLYNIEAYRRLFPPDYVKMAKPAGYETGYWALWGQFVARDGRPREPITTQFLDCLDKQETVDGCLRCFPYQVLRPESPIKVFYDFYEI